MKRSELLALADDLERHGRPGGMCQQATTILRQIAEAQPFVWYDDDSGETWTVGAIKDGGAPSGLRPLYTLPLED